MTLVILRISLFNLCSLITLPILEEFALSPLFIMSFFSNL